MLWGRSGASAGSYGERVLASRSVPSAVAGSSSARLTYDLRRLRLHGLIERLPHSHRYRLTPNSLHTTLFFTRTYGRILRPGLARILPAASGDDRLLRPAFDKLDAAIDHFVDQAKLAAWQT